MKQIIDLFLALHEAHIKMEFTYFKPNRLCVPNNTSANTSKKCLLTYRSVLCEQVEVKSHAGLISGGGRWWNQYVLVTHGTLFWASYTKLERTVHFCFTNYKNEKLNLLVL